MKNRKLVIGISTLDESLRETLKACKKAERGQFSQPITRIDFTEQDTLFSILSPKRMELLRHLRKMGPLSARRLAKNLSRDYKNIHSDIKMLSRLGLVSVDQNKKHIVPWSNITIELALAA